MVMLESCLHDDTQALAACSTLVWAPLAPRRLLLALAILGGRPPHGAAFACQPAPRPASPIALPTQAFGPDGLGLLTVSGVPGYQELREQLLPLAAEFAVRGGGRRKALLRGQ